jgi:hypothetical protein
VLPLDLAPVLLCTEAWGVYGSASARRGRYLRVARRRSGGAGAAASGCSSSSSDGDLTPESSSESDSSDSESDSTVEAPGASSRSSAALLCTGEETLSWPDAGLGCLWYLLLVQGMAPGAFSLAHSPLRCLRASTVQLEHMLHTKQAQVRGR